MAKVYKRDMLAILTTLGVTKPDNITMDQAQLEGLIAKVKTALDTYDPLPTGNAAVTDVLAGKTFSNATGTGKTGTLTLAMLTDDADAVDTDLLVGKTAYVNGVKLDGALTLAMLTADADAVVTDINAGKTAYVNGVKVVGIQVFTTMPTPTPIVLGSTNMLLVTMAPLYADYFDSIQILDGLGEPIGVAVLNEGAYEFSLADLVLVGGDISIGVKYVAKSTVTLSDSAVAAVAFSTVDITRTLTGCVDSNIVSRLIEETSISGTLSLLDGFNTLPAAITVTAGETPLILDTDYTYTAATGEYTILAAAVTANITIVAIATE